MHDEVGGAHVPSVHKLSISDPAFERHARYHVCGAKRGLLPSMQLLLEKLTAAQLSPVVCFAYSSILKMEAACSPETSTTLQATLFIVNAVRTTNPTDETSCKRSAVF
jgi:hypothetical protein